MAVSQTAKQGRKQKFLQKSLQKQKKVLPLQSRFKGNGVLAQLVERLNGIQKVRSSILLCSTDQTDNQSLKALTHKFTHKNREVYA